MMDDSLAQRARTCILAGALGDAWPYLAGAGQQPLFPSSPQLSSEIWLTLATCEAMARAGGRVRAAQVADVFREWDDRARVRPTDSVPRGLAPDADERMLDAHGRDEGLGPVLRATPLAFVLDPARDDDRAVLFDVTRMTHDSDEACAAALAGVVAVRCCLQLDRAPGGSAGPRGGRAAREPDARSPVRGGSRARQRRSAADRIGDADDMAGGVAWSLIIATKCLDGDLEAAFGEAALLGREGHGVAALTGQILGAAGAAVPRAWLERLPDPG